MILFHRAATVPWQLRILTLAALSCLLASASSPAQAPKAKAKDEAPMPSPSEMQVVPLKNANAAELVNVLQNILHQRGSRVLIGADSRSNSLVVTAPADEMTKVIDVIAKLDTASVNSVAEATRINVFQLKYIEPDKALEEALRLVLRNAGGFALDRQRKTVIVSAGEPKMSEVQALLARLDVELPRLSGNVQVRVVWLMNGLADAPAPPDDIKDVLPNLVKLGIDKPRLAAQTLINVAPNAQFQSKGVAKLETPCQFSVSGVYSDKKDAPGLQISIKATRERVTRNERSNEEVCHLQTEISAPPGHLVVLGVTPTDATSSVFVVQVLRPETKKPAPAK